MTLVLVITFGYVHKNTGNKIKSRQWNCITFKSFCPAKTTTEKTRSAEKTVKESTVWSADTEQGVSANTYLIQP